MLTTELASTGQAIDQLIQRSSTGEGYAWPLISKDNDVFMDTIRIKNLGNNSIQSAYRGTGSIGTMYAYGRPLSHPLWNELTDTFDDKIYAPRLLTYLIKYLLLLLILYENLKVQQVIIFFHK